MSPINGIYKGANSSGGQMQHTNVNIHKKKKKSSPRSTFLATSNKKKAPLQSWV
jgi:hypothetical protein